MDYNINFQDNIPSYEFNERVKGILNWIKENREKNEGAKDPNAYELTNVYLLAAKYIQEKQQINTDNLKQMWDIRSQDFARCGVTQDSFIYKICEDSYVSAMQGKAPVNDENSHHALRKLAGIGLYLKQEQRNNEKINYDNPGELIQLLECSKTLRTFHPDLFDKYRFSPNIDKIVQLQLQHEMPEQISEKIQQLQQQLQQESSINKDNIEHSTTQIKPREEEQI